MKEGSLGWSSKFESRREEQRIGPYEQCGEGDHVTDIIDHGDGQSCYYMCSEGGVLDLGGHLIPLGNHYERDIERTEKSSYRYSV